VTVPRAARLRPPTCAPVAPAGLGDSRRPAGEAAARRRRRRASCCAWPGAARRAAGDGDGVPVARQPGGPRARLGARRTRRRRDARRPGRSVATTSSRARACAPAAVARGGRCLDALDRALTDGAAAARVDAPGCSPAGAWASATARSAAPWRAGDDGPDASGSTAPRAPAAIRVGPTCARSCSRRRRTRRPPASRPHRPAAPRPLHGRAPACTPRSARSSHRCGARRV
jgi:hypothetical protein